MLEVVATLKALSVAKSPVIWLWRKATLEIFVARDIRKAAREYGLSANLKALRTALLHNAVLNALIADDSGSRGRASIALCSALPASQRSEESAGTLLSLAENSYLQRLAVGAGRVLATSMVKSAVTSSADRVVDRLEARSDDEALFETRLAAMHPLRAEDARALKTHWSGVTQVVGTLARAADLRGVFTDWISAPPKFLEGAPPEAYAWLAQVASDSGNSAAAAYFFDAALANGISPRGYWMVRRVWASDLSEPNEVAAFLTDAPDHALVRFMRADFAHQREEMHAVLERWEPDRVGDEAIKLICFAQLAVLDGDLDAAIGFGTRAYDEFSSISGALIAAKAMIGRSAGSEAAIHGDDLSRALSMASSARNDLRRWRMPSGQPLALMVRSKRLLADVEGAWTLTEPYPQGDAAPDELSDPQVSALRASLAAERGNVAEAENILDTLESTAERERVLALIAEVEGRSADSIRHWNEVMDEADDWNDKADVALQLAFHGVLHPFVRELSADNAAVAAELTLVAELFSGQGGAVERARAAAARSRRMVLVLLAFFQKQGDTHNVLVVGEEYARRWNDPDLWVRVARLRQSRSEHAKAIDAVTAALAASPPDWGGQRDAFRLLVECYSALDDWGAATTFAARLVEREPQNPSAVWALVICLHQSGESEMALNAWIDHGRPSPTDRWATATWIQLLNIFGYRVGSVEDIVSVADQWRADEEIRRALVAASFMANLTDPEESNESAQENTLLSDYIADFPESKAFVSIQVDPEDVLGSIQAQLGGPRPDLTEFDRKITRAELPLGLAADAYHKPYAEAIIHRVSGARYAHGSSIDTEIAAIEAGIANGVVLDSTAVFGLSLLPDDVADLCLGLFNRTATPTEQYRDAEVAKQSMERSSRLSLVPEQGDLPPGLHEVDEALHAQRLREIDKFVTMFGATPKLAHPRLSNLADTFDDYPRAGVWFAAADLSAESGSSFWCDDGVLRNVSESLGVRPFGTPALIDYLLEKNVIDRPLAVVAKATLVSKFYVAIPFDKGVYDLAPPTTRRR